MPTHDRIGGNSRLPPKFFNDTRIDVHRIVKWVVATFGALIVTTLLLLLLRGLIHSYAFDQGAAQVNTMNLPQWASTPVSWAVGAGIVLALPALFRLFITSSANPGDRRWLIALLLGALTANYMSSFNTPRREGCDEMNACFGAQGQPLRWYSIEHEGRVVLWNKGGRHPTRNVPLLPITADVVAQWQAQSADSTFDPQRVATAKARGASGSGQ